MIDTPVIGEGKDKLIDGLTICRFIATRKPRLIVIERVSARPGQGVVSMFNFGVSFGVLLGLATASQARVQLVWPQKWQKTYGLIGKPKSSSIREAYLRFPNSRDRLARKKDDGRAEALLLADYGIRSVITSLSSSLTAE